MPTSPPRRATGHRREGQAGLHAGGKEWRVHLDGYNILPFLTAQVETSPREEIFYFGQGAAERGALDDWKATSRCSAATRRGAGSAGWPVINLRADPYEKAPDESGMYIRWYAENHVAVRAGPAKGEGVLLDLR